MATTVEHMPPEAAGTPQPQPAPAAPDGTAQAPTAPATPHDTEQPAAPAAAGSATLDDATLERLAAIFRADQRQPDRPTWQSSLLTALVAALLAAAVPGFLSLRSDISTLGTSLCAEMQAGDDALRAEIGSLRAEIGTLRTEMRTEIGSLRSEMTAADESLRAELREFRAEFNKVALDHTQRLARLEAAHPHPADR